MTTSLRLRSGLRAYLEDLAERSQRSVSDVAEQLLEEAIRTRECPGIYFADEPAGRTAKIMGTGLGVWEVMRDYVAAGEREERLREIFPQLTPVQVGAARNYFLRYRDEIQRRIDENTALTPEGVVARYPGLVRLAG
ncbi:MAG: CopG family transcriptional regulator [Candidatus Rokubacteria bacterium]|nr:CopG family transcriptional regulator [Candidatus Rokubacteria bacterium]MBI3456581.1 CopG family transcriptional regulator [Candidatus Rokubacteria bacterium]